MNIEAKNYDLAVDPCPPSMLRNLIGRGFPPEAVRPDGSLDAGLAAERGWIVQGAWVMGPE